MRGSCLPFGKRFRRISMREEGRGKGILSNIYALLILSYFYITCGVDMLLACKK